MQGERREAMFVHRLSFSTQQIAKNLAPCGFGLDAPSASSGLLDGGHTACAVPPIIWHIQAKQKVPI